MKTHFHMKGFALSLALKRRQKATWKWPVLSADEVGLIIRMSLRTSHCQGGTKTGLERVAEIEPTDKANLMPLTQGRVVQTPVNANLGLKVNQGFCFSC